MSPASFPEHDAQLGRLVRVHGFAKPDWMYLVLAGVIALYTLGAFIVTFEVTRLLLGLAVTLGTALISICRIPKRVGIYEFGMIVESPLFFSTQTILFSDVRNVQLEYRRVRFGSNQVNVEIELTNCTWIYLGGGVEDAQGIANTVSYQRGVRQPTQQQTAWR